MTDIVVVDLSHWQPNPDWAALKASGIVGVILKCTQGKSYTDPTFAERYASAHKAGLAVASYHFLEHGSAADQMKFYLKTLNPKPGERVIIDFEDRNCTIDDLHEAVTSLLDSVLEISVYGSSSFLNNKVGVSRDALLADNTSLWLANYTSASSPQAWPTKTWSSWSLWQFSQSGKVAGIAGNVDVNRFNGTVENAIKWLGPAQPQVSPAPVPTPDPVPVGGVGEVTISVHVDAPPGVKVTLKQV